MARKRYTAEQIIGLLRQAEVLVGQGQSMEAMLREIGVTANTYYRWRKEYGGLGVGQFSKHPPRYSNLHLLYDSVASLLT